MRSVLLFIRPTVSLSAAGLASLYKFVACLHSWRLECSHVTTDLTDTSPLNRCNPFSRLFNVWLVHLQTFSSHIKVAWIRHDWEFLCVCPSGPFVFLVQRAIQAVQCIQGNVHPLLLQAALHLLLSLCKLPAKSPDQNVPFFGCLCTFMAVFTARRVSCLCACSSSGCSRPTCRSSFTTFVRLGHSREYPLLFTIKVSESYSLMMVHIYLFCCIYCR